MQDDTTPGRLIAQKLPQLTQKLFPGHPQNQTALEGLLILLCQCTTKTGAALQPIRSHNFFRNIDGLWACSNPNCTQIEEQYKWDDRKIGKLYRSPGINTCPCGAKIYEAPICRGCGEIYLAGYNNQEAGENYLSKHPVKQHPKRITIWNRKITPEQKTDTHWNWATLNIYTGKFQKTIQGNLSIFQPDDSYPIEYPNYCPNCHLTYKTEDKHSLSPISTHNTGVQKVNQVMADALMRILKTGKNDQPKLVLFSDSRQAAAKLSAGIELDHYRDVLRQTVLNSLAHEDENIHLLRKIRQKQPLTETDKNRIKTWIQEKNQYAEKYLLIKGEEDMYFPEDKEIIELNSFLKKTTPGLQNIQYKVFLDILRLGINPAGPKPSLNNWRETPWHKLFQWTPGNITRKDIGTQTTFFDNIIFQCNVEQLVIIFAHKNRSFEALKLGYVTANITGEDPKFTQFVDVAIRLLGENWRIDGYETKYQRTGLPQSIWKYARQIYGDTKRNKPNIDKLTHILQTKQILKSTEKILTGEGLYFKKNNPRRQPLALQKMQHPTPPRILRTLHKLLLANPRKTNHNRSRPPQPGRLLHLSHPITTLPATLRRTNRANLQRRLHQTPATLSGHTPQRRKQTGRRNRPPQRNHHYGSRSRHRLPLSRHDGKRTTPTIQLPATRRTSRT